MVLVKEQVICDHQGLLWNPYTNELGNLEESDKFLGTYNWTRLNNQDTHTQPESMNNE